MSKEPDSIGAQNSAHEDFLALLRSPPEGGDFGNLLGPAPCLSPDELKGSLPVKKKYLGPGAWYSYLKQGLQEERNDQD